MSGREGRPASGKRKVSNRRAGYDFTFSAPKSVSLYLASNEDKVVEQMITEAVDETMAAIEGRSLSFTE
jgi:conjugative relaxase-like TrwC/TraI family protein